jgi:hypothetical protein
MHELKIWTLFASIIFLQLFLPKPIQAFDGSVNVTYPAGGETFTEGDTVTIRWSSSPNIDKVSIMRKTDAHHGSWVATNIPNTGSHTWNVDVGNTTNTQFYIEIIAYETGKGSVTNFGNYFTVNQKPNAPNTPAQPSPTPRPSQSSYSSSNQGASTTTFISNTWITITNITLWDIFIFDGSQTTNLKTVPNPKSVEKFTLESKQGYLFVFNGTLNFTNQTVLNAFQKLKDYWMIQEWTFWIKEEWWTRYRINVPIETTYKNERLTRFAPEVKQTSNSKESKPEITSADIGKVSFTLTGPGKVSVSPRVELSGEKETTSWLSEKIFNGKSSHDNLKYLMRINGVDSEIALSSFNKETGEFDIRVKNLVPGANFIQFYFVDPVNNEKILFAERTVYFKSSILSWIAQRGKTIAVASLIVFSGLVGFTLNKWQKILRRIRRKIVKKTKK